MKAPSNSASIVHDVEFYYESEPTTVVLHTCIYIEKGLELWGQFWDSNIYTDPELNHNGKDMNFCGDIVPDAPTVPQSLQC